ncbi:hypothetical protein GGE66_002439 [Rhizobium leguminosarum]|uniref:Uncharacterized protein n=1 Tax=Rhizobium leguminosarum TaxID=384 RepID=A0A7W9ZRG5_RHILE|nr:hypothetical protein [Rhizobium leguminosarum]
MPDRDQPGGEEGQHRDDDHAPKAPVQRRIEDGADRRVGGERRKPGRLVQRLVQPAAASPPA